MAKNITFNTDARAKLAKGVNTLADAVTVTMGPKGLSLIHIWVIMMLDIVCDPCDSLKIRRDDFDVLFALWRPHGR